MMKRSLALWITAFTLIGVFATTCDASARRRRCRLNQCTSVLKPCARYCGTCGICNSPDAANDKASPLRLITFYGCTVFQSMQGTQGNNLYYGIEYEHPTAEGCRYVGPMPMYGSFPFPMTCHDCQPIGFAPDSKPPTLEDFPGYPGEVKNEMFDPLVSHPDLGGFPNLATRPTRHAPAPPRPVKFLAGSRTIYAVVHTFKLNVQELGRLNGRPEYQRLPTDFQFQIGYEVATPSDPARFVSHNPEILTTKLYVTRPHGEDPNETNQVLMILSQRNN